MARFILLNMIVIWQRTTIVSAADCTEGCEDEVETCINHKMNTQGADADSGRQTCRNEIDAGNVPMLTNAGCVSGCTFSIGDIT